MAKLRGRKSPEEIRRIKKNIDLTEEIFDRVTGVILLGIAEKVATIEEIIVVRKDGGEFL